MKMHKTSRKYKGSISAYESILSFITSFLNIFNLQSILADRHLKCYHFRLPI